MPFAVSCGMVVTAIHYVHLVLLAQDLQLHVCSCDTPLTPSTGVEKKSWAQHW